MENSLSRLSMNVQRPSYPERKGNLHFELFNYLEDVIPSTSHFGPVPACPHQPARWLTRGGRRTPRRRDAESSFTEQLEVFEEEHRPPLSLSHRICEPTVAVVLGDGYIQASLEDLKRVVITPVSSVEVGSKLDLVLLRRSRQRLYGRMGIPLLQPVEPAPTRCYDFSVEITQDQLKQLDKTEKESLEALKSACLRDGDVELIPHISYMIDQLSMKLEQESVLLMKQSFAEGNHEFIPVNPDPSCLSDCYNSKAVAFDQASPNSYEVPNGEDIFLYQAADGQPIFLDGLMWNCLLTEYGSFCRLPNPLSVTVTSIKSHKMTSMLRKRWRHLDHLHLGQTFKFIEIDLHEVVSRDTLNKFTVPLTARQAEHNRRRLEDLRLTKLKEAAENRIPSLPPGFVLSGHAELLEKPQSPPKPSEFAPLCSIPESGSRPSSSSASFAEVTKLGALSVVGHNRVATFSRTSASRLNKPVFNPTAEIWPSLNDSSASREFPSPSAGVKTLTWLPSHKELTTGLITSEQNAVQSVAETSTQSASRRQRKRRSRNNSLFEPFVN
ncbi:uncharacterized protein DEA37_0001410 [Paragonimus westermani]|uniref:Uncharacterized protein n=1 Tax=Paragonimus westermani TaxID=34504 RepID=A0A5J4NIY9_9TREM|nr:uncharacterized protein DEA37_0001410 [Paragonimus westermani]